MADKLTYTTKESVTDNQLPAKNKGRAEDWNEVKTKFNTLIDELGTGATSDNLIIYSVNSTGDLASVVAAITDASASKIYKIQVRPGDYTTTPVTLQPYIYINGVDKAACRFTASSVSDTIFTLVGSSGIDGLTVIGATSGKGIDYTSSSGFAFANNVTEIDCQTGISFNGSGTAAMEIDGVSFNGTFTTGVDHNGGNLILRAPVVVGDSTLTTFISSDSSASILTLDRPLTFSANVVTGISFTNGARISGNDFNVVGATDGIVISGTNTQARISAGGVFNCTNDAFRVDNTGTGIIVELKSVTLEGSSNLNVNILNVSTTLTGLVYTDSSLTKAVDGATIIIQISDDFEGDEGLKNLGELAVGSQLRPSEFIAGEGDSHVFLKCYSEISTGGFTDRTTAAKSASGSTLTFDNNLANSAIYIANDLETTGGDHLVFHGVKVIIDTACVCNYGDVVTEYWNGSAWTVFNSSTQLADAPHWKYRKEYFNRTGNYHIKFNPAILDDWTENDPMSTGTTRHWMRFRLTNTVTTAPIFQQFKISTNRSEINPDGSKEGHGYGRNIKKLNLDASGPIEGNMQSQSIYVDNNVGVAFSNNRFTAVADIYGLSFELPEDCDTSIPIIIAWKGKFSSAGSPQFTVRRNIVAPGDPYTNTEPVASGKTQTVLSTIRAVTADVREDFSVEIDVSDAIPSRSGGFGDEIWVTIQNTTRAGNFDHTKYSANYGSDFDGRHLKQS
jgi:hypothetical protein